MIVCGLNPVGLRTVEQLHLAGARVVVLDDDPDERLARIVRGWGIPHIPRGSHHLSDPLYEAGIAGAAAVVCAESTDLRTLETVLLIRDLRPEVRVVADLDNPAVATRSRRCSARWECSTSPRCSPPRWSKRAWLAARATSCWAMSDSWPPR